MREIKFRAWDKEYKEIHTWDYLIDSMWELSIFAEDSPFILMQFTGLLDKNGLEIYEGDIVGWPCGDMVNGPVRCECEVRWDLWDDHGYENGAGWHIPCESPVEVIGNIYEGTTGR